MHAARASPEQEEFGFASHVNLSAFLILGTFNALGFTINPLIPNDPKLKGLQATVQQQYGVGYILVVSLRNDESVPAPYPRLVW